MLNKSNKAIVIFVNFSSCLQNFFSDGTGGFFLNTSFDFDWSFFLQFDPKTIQKILENGMTEREYEETLLTDLFHVPWRALVMQVVHAHKRL